MGDTTTPEPQLNRAGRRAESRRLRKTGALMAAIPAALGTTAIVVGATAGTAGATDYVVMNLNATGADSLHDLAEAAGDGDVITFDASLTGTITLDDDIDIDTSITIIGPGADVIAVSGDDTVQVFNLDSSGAQTVSISGLTVRDGSSGFGGGLRAQDDTTLTLSDMVFTGNTSTGGGGAIAIENNDTDLVVERTEISGNDALDGWGGGIYFYSEDGSVTVTDSVLSGNTASSGGGAAWLGGSGSTSMVSGSTITDNRAEGSDSGGIGFYTDTTTVSASTFSGNSAADNGGGLYVGGNQGPALIQGTVVSGNTSGDGGGGIYLWSHDGSITIVDTTVSGNTAQDNGGGGIYVGSSEYAGGVFIRNSTISGNTAEDGDGGGMYVAYHAGPVEVSNSTISGNSASREGGGVAIFDYSGVTFDQVTITANTGATVGGIFLGATGEQSAEQKGDDGGDETRAGDPDDERGPRTIGHHGAGARSIFGASSAFLSGTIVSGNSGVDIGSYGEATAAGSLIGTISGTTLTDQGGNQFGVDPLLGPLQDNGGPTQTHALLDGSPAVNAGPDPVADFPGNADDQRGPGYPRVVGGRVDIGAFEVQPSTIEPDFTG